MAILPNWFSSGNISSRPIEHHNSLTEEKILLKKYNKLKGTVAGRQGFISLSQPFSEQDIPVLRWPANNLYFLFYSFSH